MSVRPDELKTTVVQATWYRELSKYEKPDSRKAGWQVLNTFVPYIGLWAAMIWIVRSQTSLWYLCPLILIAAGLVVRIFIMQHDCGHGSFLKSHSANRFLGLLCGVITFTPYDDWKHEHAAHHASAQDLERRGIGDIQTLTTEEYRNATFGQKLYYRLFRHPVFIFGVGPFIQFVGVHRFSHKRSGKRERQSVLITNVALAALVTLACLTIGWRTYVLIQAPIIALAASLGVWLFYVQHQYDDVYWEHHEQWDPIRAALHDGPSRLRVGILPDGRAPAREGTAIVDAAGTAIGHITSGGFGPSLNAPLAMGYVRADMAVDGTPVFLMVRGKPLPARIAPMPFVPHSYNR